MATWVHRKSENDEMESVLIDVQFIDSHLKAGFCFSKEELGKTTPTFQQADTNNSGKLSSTEVREAAKDAAIEGYETKRISTLKKELGYDQED